MTNASMTTMTKQRYKTNTHLQREGSESCHSFFHGNSHGQRDITLTTDTILSFRNNSPENKPPPAPLPPPPKKNQTKHHRSQKAKAAPNNQCFFVFILQAPRSKPTSTTTQKKKKRSAKTESERETRESERPSERVLRSGKGETTLRVRTHSALSKIITIP